MDPLLLLAYFALPATITLIAFAALKLHERSAPPVEDVKEDFDQTRGEARLNEAGLRRDQPMSITQMRAAMELYAKQDERILAILSHRPSGPHPAEPTGEIVGPRAQDDPVRGAPGDAAPSRR